MSRIRDAKIIAEVGGLVDETHLTLGIFGPDLDPTEISRLLACAPTSARRRGEARDRDAKPWADGAWILTVGGESPMGPNELVELLTSHLPTSVAVWQRVTRSYTIQVTFGIFVANWNRGFELSPEAIGRLARFGVPIGFDIYRDEDPGAR